MTPMLPAIKAAWGFARPFLPYILGALAVWGWGTWKGHQGYEKGYSEAEAAYQAAVLQASEKFMAELAARDRAVSEAQGQVVEVVKWRTRTETVYQEAVKNDPDCAAWAAAPIRCPLGLQAHPDGGPALPGDPP